MLSIKVKQCLIRRIRAIIFLVNVQYLDKMFTLWDRFEVSGEKTVGQFIDYFKV